VECLASTWGVQSSTAGVTVWAILPAPPREGAEQSHGNAPAVREA
jgi:hypothetical protein